MAKLIITKDYAKTNLLIELCDGSQVELDVSKQDLLDALNSEEEQEVIQVSQTQPQQ